MLPHCPALLSPCSLLVITAYFGQINDDDDDDKMLVHPAGDIDDNLEVLRLRGHSTRTMRFPRPTLCYLPVYAWICQRR